VFRAVSFRW